MAALTGQGRVRETEHCGAMPVLFENQNMMRYSGYGPCSGTGAAVGVRRQRPVLGGWCGRWAGCRQDGPGKQPQAVLHGRPPVCAHRAALPNPPAGNRRLIDADGRALSTAQRWNRPGAGMNDFHPAAGVWCAPSGCRSAASHTRRRFRLRRCGLMPITPGGAGETKRRPPGITTAVGGRRGHGASRPIAFSAVTLDGRDCNWFGLAPLAGIGGGVSGAAASRARLDATRACGAAELRAPAAASMHRRTGL